MEPSGRVYGLVDFPLMAIFDRDGRSGEAEETKGRGGAYRANFPNMDQDD